jgi:very-short-patch-repair endonuclease
MQATKQNHNLYNKNLQPFANENRKQMAKSEACLWKFILKSKQMGYTFNRQRPVLNYIADFMCKPLRLIIEVDDILTCWMM